MAIWHSESGAIAYLELGDAADRLAVERALVTAAASPPPDLSSAELVAWYAGKCGTMRAEVEALAIRLLRRLR